MDTTNFLLAYLSVQGAACFFALAMRLHFAIHG